MKHPRPFALLVAAYVAGLIVTLPAAFLDKPLNRISNGQLRLAEANGTVWAGSGRIQFRTANDRPIYAPRVAWYFQPVSLLKGSAGFSVDVERSPQNFTLAISFTRVAIANAEIYLPARTMALAVPKFDLLGLGGNLRIFIRHIEIQTNTLEGAGSIQWSMASSKLTSVSPLGAYELSIDSRDKVTHAALRTLEGPLMLNGRDTVNANHKRSFLMTINVPEQLQTELRPLLRMISTERSDGQFEALMF